MQSPIEQSHSVPIAILIIGTMFAIAHLDFTPILWRYYVAVAAIYDIVTHLTQSILPSIVLHTAGNIYSNLDLWMQMQGQAEWQKSAGSSTGSLAPLSIALGVAFILAAFSLAHLARIARRLSAQRSSTVH